MANAGVVAAAFVTTTFTTVPGGTIGWVLKETAIGEVGPRLDCAMTIVPAWTERTSSALAAIAAPVACKSERYQHPSAGTVNRGKVSVLLDPAVSLIVAVNSDCPGASEPAVPRLTTGETSSALPYRSYAGLWIETFGYMATSRKQSLPGWRSPRRPC